MEGEFHLRFNSVLQIINALKGGLWPGDVAQWWGAKHVQGPGSTLASKDS